MTEQRQLRNVLVNRKIGEEISRRKHGQEIKNVKGSRRKEIIVIRSEQQASPKRTNNEEKNLKKYIYHNIKQKMKYLMLKDPLVIKKTYP